MKIVPLGDKVVVKRMEAEERTAGGAGQQFRADEYRMCHVAHPGWVCHVAHC